MDKLLITIPTTWFDPQSFLDRAEWFLQQLNTVVIWSNEKRLNKSYNSPDFEPEIIESIYQHIPVFVGTDENLESDMSLKIYFPEDYQYLRGSIPDPDDTFVLLNTQKLNVKGKSIIKVSITDIVSANKSIKNVVNIYGIGLKRQVCLSLAKDRTFIRSYFNMKSDFKYVAQIDYNCGHIYHHTKSDGKHSSPQTGKYNKVTYKLSTMYEALKHILDNIRGAAVVGINKRHKGKALGSADTVVFKSESMSLHKFYIFNLDLINDYHSPLHDSMAEDITLWARLNINGRKTYRLGSYGQDDIRDYETKTNDRSSRFNIAYVCPQNKNMIFVPYVEYYSGSYDGVREYGCENPQETSGIYFDRKYYVQPKPREALFNPLNYVPIFITNGLFSHVSFKLSETQSKKYMKDNYVDQILYRDIFGDIDEFKNVPGFEHSSLCYSNEILTDFFNKKLNTKEMITIARHQVVLPVETSWNIRPSGQIHSTTINFGIRYFVDPPVSMKSKRKNVEYVYLLDLFPENLTSNLRGIKKYDLRWDIIMLCLNLFLVLTLRIVNNIKIDGKYITLEEVTYLDKLSPSNLNVSAVVDSLMMWANQWLSSQNLIQSIDESIDFMEEDSYGENDDDSYMDVDEN